MRTLCTVSIQAHPCGGGSRCQLGDGSTSVWTASVGSRGLWVIHCWQRTKWILLLQEGAVPSPSLYPGSTERKINSPLQYHQVHKPSALMSDSYCSCLVHVCIYMSAALAARGATIMHQTRHTDDFRSLGSHKILHLCIRFVVSKVLCMQPSSGGWSMPFCCTSGGSID